MVTPVRVAYRRCSLIARLPLVPIPIFNSPVIVSPATCTHVEDPVGPCGHTGHCGPTGHCVDMDSLDALYTIEVIMPDTTITVALIFPELTASTEITFVAKSYLI